MANAGVYGREAGPSISLLSNGFKNGFATDRVGAERARPLELWGGRAGAKPFLAKRLGLEFVIPDLIRDPAPYGTVGRKKAGPRIKSGVTELLVRHERSPTLLVLNPTQSVE